MYNFKLVVSTPLHQTVRELFAPACSFVERSGKEGRAGVGLQLSFIKLFAHLQIRFRRQNVWPKPNKNDKKNKLIVIKRNKTTKIVIDNCSKMANIKRPKPQTLIVSKPW